MLFKSKLMPFFQFNDFICVEISICPRWGFKYLVGLLLFVADGCVKHFSLLFLTQKMWTEKEGP
jgi:hypothetical protein